MSAVSVDESRELDAAKRARYFRQLLDASGHPLPGGAKLLDFGCGQGAMVRVFHDHGFDAYGCDFATNMADFDSRLCPLATDPYRVPFEDGEFDCVISDQVFEHVQDYEAALSEIRRVLRPGGVSLHLFPPRFCLREPHTFVPLATIFQNHGWLLLWSALGVRNQFQGGKLTREVARLNHVFLREQTTYYSRHRLLQKARRVFPSARLIEQEILASRPTRRSQLLSTGARRFPLIATVFCELKMRGLLAAVPR